MIAGRAERHSMGEAPRGGKGLLPAGRKRTETSRKIF